MLSPELQGHQAEGEWICGSKGRVAPIIGFFLGRGQPCGAPALGPVFNPAAHFLNSLEPGPREPTGATLLVSCPTFMEASVSRLVPGAPHLSLPGVGHLAALADPPEEGVHDLGPVLLRGCGGGLPLRRMEEATEDVG